MTDKVCKKRNTARRRFFANPVKPEGVFSTTLQAGRGLNNFFDSEMRKMKPSCLPRRAGWKHIPFWPWEVIAKFDFRLDQVRSGQGQVMTQVGQYTNTSYSKRLDVPRIVWHHLRVSVSILSRLIAETRIVTSFDLIWPQVTSPWPPIVSCIRIITEAWVAMIQKELGGFGRFMRDVKYFHISP